MLCPRVLAPAIASSEQIRNRRWRRRDNPPSDREESRAPSLCRGSLANVRFPSGRGTGKRDENLERTFSIRCARSASCPRKSLERKSAPRVARPRRSQRKKLCLAIHSLIFLRQMKTRRVRRAMRHTIFVAVALDDPPTGTVAALQIGRSGDVYCKGSVSSSSVSARGAGSLEAATIFSGRL